jgi:PAS domain S-box-containing protein
MFKLNQKIILVIFSFLFPVLAFFIFANYEYKILKKQNQKNFVHIGAEKITQKIHFFREEINKISSLLFSINQNNEFSEYVQEQNLTKNKKKMDHLFITLAKNYDSIRELKFIDKKGLEQIVVEKATNGYIFIKEDSDLKDISKEKLFSESQKQEKKYLQFSNLMPTNLNNPEFDIKLNMFLPIYKKNRFEGLLFVRYSIKKLLNRFMSDYIFDLILIDKHGYILIDSANKKNNWSKYQKKPFILTEVQNKANISSKIDLERIISEPFVVTDSYASKSVLFELPDKLKVIISPKNNLAQASENNFFSIFINSFFIFLVFSFLGHLVLLIFIIRLKKSSEKIIEQEKKIENLSSQVFKLEKEELKKSTLLSLFDKGSVVIFKWKNEENWQVDYVSKNVKNLFDYSKEEFMNEISYSSIVHTEDLQRVFNEVNQAIEQNKSFFAHKPYRIITKQGKEKWVLDNTQVIKNSDNEITHFLGYIIDITELIKKEYELKISKDTLQTAIEGNGDGFWDWNIKTSEIHFSKQWKTMLGFDENELEFNLSEWKNRIHHDDLPEVMKDLDKYLDKKSTRYSNTHRIRKKDNSYIWVLDRGVIVEWDEYGEPVRMIGTHTDMTEHQNVILELEKSEQKLKYLLEISPIAVRVAVNNGQEVIFANQAYSELIKVPMDEILRVNPINYYANQKDYEEIKLKLSNNITIVNKLVHLKIPNSGTEWALASYAKIQFEGQESVLGWFFDITEIKNLEKNLIEARYQSEQANRAKSEFLANMSHEIRTPLNGVIGLTDLTLETELNSTQRDYLLKAKQSSKALLNVLNDILDYSKVEAGKLDLEEEEFSIDEILENITAMFGYKAEEKNIHLFYNVDSECPRFVIGDPLRLSQVLNNLIGNALKFTEQGEIAINIKKLEIQENKIKLLFEIKDTGIGLSEERQKKLFKAFSQADNSHTRKYGGTGLGLAISKQIVNLFNGEIEVESKEGIGSNFKFSSTFGISKNSFNFLRSDSLIGKKVLIIDDQQFSLNILSNQIKKLKMEFTAISDGKIALESIKNNHYDYVLLDWIMPEYNGLELLKDLEKLQQENKISSVPVILMITAHSKNNLMSVMKQENLEYKTILNKPVTNSLLFEALMGSSLKNNNKIDKSKIEQKIIFNSKILLVEDNQINQLIAVKNLEHFGIKVSIANDGLEAVNKVKSEEFSMILMDIQMPVMDGFQATKEIRKDFSQENLPIVAMSAAVMEKDIDKAREAGMNDHLGKPFKREDLKNILEKWIPKSEIEVKISTQTSLKKEQEQNKDTSMVINFQKGFNLLDNDKEMFFDFLEGFLDFYSDANIKLEQLLEQDKEKTELKRFLHSLKGVTGQICADKLHEEVKFLENEVINQKSINLVNFNILFDEVIQEINRTLNTKITKSENSFNKAEVEKLINNLSQKIIHSDMIDEQEVQSLENLLGEYSNSDNFKKLLESINKFDYSEAEVNLNKLKGEIF